MSTTLPTPRSHLTSLLTTLFTPNPPPPPSNTQSQTSNPSSAINPLYSTLQPERQNPLKSLSPNQKALLATLHVLFPPPMLLQALDLLDRGLVKCYSINSPEKEEIQRNSDGAVSRNEDTEEEGLNDTSNAKSFTQPPATEEKQKQSLPFLPKSNTNVSRNHHIYQVSSSTASTTSTTNKNTPRFPSHAHHTTFYTVHLEAWNCSCAAFAFAAFPYLPSTDSNHSNKPWGYESVFEEGDDEAVESERGGEREWEVGGLSFDGIDGREGEGVPVCKHLLACLLGERWELLEGWVERKEVGREEGGGLGVGG